MPIVFLSPDCRNDNLKDLPEIVDAFDFVFTSTDQDSQDLCDTVSEKIPCMHLFTTEYLDMDHCSVLSFNIVMQKFSLRSGSVLIIASKKYFNSLMPNFMNNDWQTLSFDEKYLS
jgi:hypothetical protein